MSNYISPLVNGRIVENTMCPFRQRCPNRECGDTIRPVPFSCGFARGWDLIDRNAAVQKVDKEQ